MMSKDQFIQAAVSYLTDYYFLLTSGETRDFGNDYDYEEGMAIKEMLDEFIGNDSVTESRKLVKESLKEEMTPADYGYEAARKDNISPIQKLDDSFETVVAAKDLIENLDIDFMQEVGGTWVANTLEEVIEHLDNISDKLDKALRDSGYSRH